MMMEDNLLDDDGEGVKRKKKKKSRLLELVPISKKIQNLKDVEKSLSRQLNANTVINSWKPPRKFIDVDSKFKFIIINLKSCVFLRLQSPASSHTSTRMSKCKKTRMVMISQRISLKERMSLRTLMMRKIEVPLHSRLAKNCTLRNLNQSC